jgi:hypothetical protein
VGEDSRTREMADIATPPRFRWRKGTRKEGRFIGCCCSWDPTPEEDENELAVWAVGKLAVEEFGAGGREVR